MPEQLPLPTIEKIEYAWPAPECAPRHRIREAGPDALTDAELLGVVLGMDSPERLRKIHALLEQVRGLAGLRSCSTRGMAGTLGTENRALRLQAVIELARRFQQRSAGDPPQIRSPEDAAALLMPEMGHLEQEQLRVLLLNTRHQVVRQVLIYQGNVNTSLVRVGEIFREAVREGCPAILVAHNHPSSDPTPSPEDVAVTKEIVEAGRLLDVDMLDHIILGRGRYVSLRERGLGFSS